MVERLDKPIAHGSGAAVAARHHHYSGWLFVEQFIKAPPL